MTKEKKIQNDQGEVLNKYLAIAGVASRRETVELIKEGHVTVNDELVTDPSYKVKSGDKVKYKDKIVKPEQKVYLLLNKPKGYITTVSDERGRRTVIDLVSDAGKYRLYPVGRLDRDTTGLLVITNDGDLAQKLSHPKYEVPKRYYAVLDKDLEVADFQKIKKGLHLPDGKIKVDKIFYVPNKPKNHVNVELHSGKNRIVKRIFLHVGYKVTKLDRTMYANLAKKDLPVGKWRHLTKEEIESLKSL